MTYAEAIEQLYAAFADVPRPTEIDGCPCCINEKEISTLLQKPLRDLTGKDLMAFALSAPSTVGDWQDYLYFFPRMFELSLNKYEAEFYAGTELLLCRTEQDKTYTFSSEQRTAIWNVLWVHWCEILRRDAEYVAAGGYYDADDLLASLFIADFPFEPFLDYWLETCDINTIGQLAHFTRFNYDEISKGGVWNACLDDEYSDNPEATERKAYTSNAIRDWLNQPAILERLRWLEAQIVEDDKWPYTLESTREAIQLLSKG